MIFGKLFNHADNTNSSAKSEFIKSIENFASSKDQELVGDISKGLLIISADDNCEMVANSVHGNGLVVCTAIVSAMMSNNIIAGIITHSAESYLAWSNKQKK